MPEEPKRTIDDGFPIIITNQAGWKQWLERPAVPEVKSVPIKVPVKKGKRLSAG